MTVEERSGWMQKQADDIIALILGENHNGYRGFGYPSQDQQIQVINQGMRNMEVSK